MASRPSNSSRSHLHSIGPALSRITSPCLRILSAFASRFANRRFLFAIGSVAVISAKLIHIYAHLNALSAGDVFSWGLSFFAQDTAILLLIRFMIDTQVFSVRWLRTILMTLSSFIVLFVLTLAAISISFFIVAGSELHWRNIGLAGDSSSWKLLLTGLVTCSLVLVTVFVVSWIIQDAIYILTGFALDILKSPFLFILNRLPIRRRAKYTHVPQDVENASELMVKEDDDWSSSSVTSEPARVSKWLVGLYALVGLGMLTQVVLYIARPNDSSLTFMSWTLPLLPFVDFARSSPTLANLIPLHGSSIDHTWDGRTALHEPPQFDWLPKDTPLQGFEDWYEGKKHYRAAEDPLRISNLEEDLLPALRGKLADVKIRHVMLIKLESTRKDVFPFKKDGYIWKKLAETFENKTIPQAAQEKLATIGSTTNFITGDYDDGFEHKEKKRRGGINANNVHTTATYTLKSLTGTLCGLSPLVADFNVEYQHHIYQPCLPNIFEAFNYNRDEGKDKAADDFTSHEWKSSFMMSVTNEFDKQDKLMPVLGFTENRTITKEYLKSDKAKFGVVDLKDINYYGMPEIALEDYIHDAFKSAKQNNERVFLTHLTSTTHHPFGLPEDTEYVPVAEKGMLEDMSKYLNTVGYVDKWLKKVLDILEEEGVADETLLVLVGDHGLSIPENNGITPYYNPNVGNFHVPLVISHPKLPAIDVNDAVISSQILPTILDLLLETGSLSKSQIKAAQDLAHNYEGQSLLRPLINFNKKTGQANWQFTIMNPGRATLGVRDTRRPNWRLTAPIIENTEWRFTDLTDDPHEERAVVAFGFHAFLHKVEKERGLDAAKWVEEGSFMTRWWVEENSKRWRFEPH